MRYDPWADELDIREAHEAAADDMRAAVGLPPRDREAERQAEYDEMTRDLLASHERTMASLDAVVESIEGEYERRWAE
jgi:hypothetical protein